MGKLCTVSKNKTGSWLWLRSWTLYCQIQTEFEESRENHWTIQICLHLIPYDYTVEVRNRFKGLDLIQCLKNCGQNSWHCTGGSDQDIPKKKRCKKAKCLSEEALQIAEERREAKGKGEKERYTHLNTEFQRLARKIRKSSSVISAKK